MIATPRQTFQFERIGYFTRSISIPTLLYWNQQEKLKLQASSKWWASCVHVFCLWFSTKIGYTFQDFIKMDWFFNGSLSSRWHPLRQICADDDHRWSLWAILKVSRIPSSSSTISTLLQSDIIDLSNAISQHGTETSHPGRYWRISNQQAKNLTLTLFLTLDWIVRILLQFGQKPYDAIDTTFFKL